MIDFQRMRPDRRAAYEHILMTVPERGCEYSFANLFLWGHQHTAFLAGCVVFFSHFFGRSVYPYPIGSGDKKAALEAILHDARTRGLPCRITGITPKDREELEGLFPGKFYFRSDRDSFDYVYDIHMLADLKGRKMQKKRNHRNRFRAEHPACRVLELTEDTLPLAQNMVEQWYARRAEANPDRDYLLEQLAMYKAFHHYGELGMEGILLMEGGEVLAVAMGSRLSPDTFDIHFEKAREDIPGVYSTVNCEFAGYLRQKHPELAFLNREDDMGIEGLRNAKLDYKPHHMVEKYWAYLREELYVD